MLHQVHMHQWDVSEYLCEYGTWTSSRKQDLFSPHLWLLFQDACIILSPFGEATRIVNHDNVCTNNTSPVVFLLEHTLSGVIDQRLEAQQYKEEEYFLVSQGLLLPAFFPMRLHEAQVDYEEK